MRGVNDADVADLLAWCLDRGYELRFIEQMPLDAQHAWDRAHMVAPTEILERLSERFTLTPLPADRGSAPAERFLVDGGPADGRASSPASRALLRSLRPHPAHRRRPAAQLPVLDARPTCAGRCVKGPATTSCRPGLARDVAQAAGHGIDGADFVQPDRPMSAIGG